jgi:hypothetical protein
MKSLVFTSVTLRSSDLPAIGLLALFVLMSWAWGAVSKAALGVSRWYGVLMLLPGVNLAAFFITGIISHRRLTAEANEAAYEQIKRLVAEADLRESNRDKEAIRD